ncbi:MAG: hypothetical protein RIC95_01665 [Vicingaceae bacterium]
MRIVRITTLLTAIFFCLAITSCNKKHNSNSGTFELFTKRTSSNGTLNYQVSTSQAIEKGLRIPSWDEAAEKSHFHFQFDFENNGKVDQKFYYKIFYQNKSYKLDEFNAGALKGYNTASANNFYGSWQDTKLGFKELGFLKPGKSKSVVDSFAVVGNPRNEYKYYGLPRTDNITPQLIASKILHIKRTPEWYQSIVDKAPANKVSAEQQLFLDALWAINDSLKGNPKELYIQDTTLKAIEKEIRNNNDWFVEIIKKSKERGLSIEEQLEEDVTWAYGQRFPRKQIFQNNRFKRNPRMGEYEFMLVIVSEEELKKLPLSAKQIDMKDEKRGGFLNPFYYFKSTEFQADGVNRLVLSTNNKLIAKTKMDVAKGVYINPMEFREPDVSTDYYSEKVANTKELFLKADFEQYFHNINYDYILRNVPIAEDVVKNYDVEKYQENKKNHPLDSREQTHPINPVYPGKTVSYDSSKKAIVITNPGNKGKKLEQFRKQNVGAKTRVGLTYGKFTGHIKFPKLINQENIWNGVTCAYWLFSEETSPWNVRNVCEEEGYLPKGAKKGSNRRLDRTSYSEIDIEIVKTSKYWPQSSYGGADDYPIDDPENNHNLIVATTNWDLACPDPDNFHQGIVPVKYSEDQEFGYHRWDYWYQAVTSKYEYPHDKTVGDELFYQIEWKPTEIIWRIGPSKDKLHVVGYLNDEYSKIPDNQMVAIVTQEFHYSLWWPLSPFDQNNIPYPLSDINGYIYSIEIE